METNYPSKRDLWLTLIVGLGAVMSSTAAVAVWMQPINWEQRLIISGLLAAQAMFLLDLLLRTDYTLTVEELRVRCGIFHWQVPYTSIESIKPGRTLLSGPALSLDRLTIKCNDRLLPLVISPLEQGRFLEELADRAAGLQVKSRVGCANQ